MASGNAEVALEILAFKRKNRVTLGYRDEALVLCPTRTLGQRAIYNQPAIAAGAVGATNGKLEGSSLAIEGTSHIEQVTDRMGRIVVRDRDRLISGYCVTGCLKRGRPGQH
jgi:hypothetical protein